MRPSPSRRVGGVCEKATVATGSQRLDFQDGKYGSRSAGNSGVATSRAASVKKGTYFEADGATGQPPTATLRHALMHAEEVRGHANIEDDAAYHRGVACVQGVAERSVPIPP
jgi:hypothetical protein